MADRVAIGIDFGTWSCSFGVFIDGEVRILEESMPSCVAFTENGRLFGQEAKDYSKYVSCNTITNVKKLMGRQYYEIMHLKEFVSFKLLKMSDDKIGIEINDKAETTIYYPEQIAAMLFAEMKRIAEKRTNKTANVAVITVPASFNSCQRKATVNAGMIAGFESIKLVDDGLALFYHMSTDIGLLNTNNVVSLDIGGGYISLNIASITKWFINEKPSFSFEFGGWDIDRMIIALFDRKNDKIEEKLARAEDVRKSFSKSNNNLDQQTQNKFDFFLQSEDFQGIFTKIKNGIGYHSPKYLKLDNFTLNTIIVTGEFSKANYIREPLVEEIQRNISHEHKIFSTEYKSVIGAILLGGKMLNMLGSLKLPYLSSIIHRNILLDNKLVYGSEFECFKAEQSTKIRINDSAFEIAEYCTEIEDPKIVASVRFSAEKACKMPQPELQFKLDSNKILIPQIMDRGSSIIGSLIELSNDISSQISQSKDKESQLKSIDSMYRKVYYQKYIEIWNELKELEKQCGHHTIISNRFKELSNEYPDEMEITEILLESFMKKVQAIKSEITSRSIQTTSYNRDRDPQTFPVRFPGSAFPVTEPIEPDINHPNVAINTENVIDNFDNKNILISNHTILIPLSVRTNGNVDVESLFYKLESKQQIDSIEGGPTIGIDFGTSTCCVAALVGRNMEVIEDDKGNRTLPSYVTFTDSGRRFGTDSKKLSLQMFDKTMLNLKELLSSDRQGEILKVENKMSNCTLSSVQVIAMFLKHMKGNAEKKLGKKVSDTVLSVPTYYSNNQRQKVREAATIADLNPVSIINDTTAVAINYRVNNSQKVSNNKKICMVFDLGAGGLSVSMVGIEKEAINVFGIGGSPAVSGKGIDMKLVEHFKNEFCKSLRYSADILREKDIHNLLLSCEKIRIALIGLQNTSCLVEKLLGLHDYFCHLTRNQFEKLNDDLEDKVITLLNKLFDTCNMRRNDVEEIIFSGGYTRVPLVQRILSSYFKGYNVKFGPTNNVDEAVALGSAFYAEVLSGETARDLIKVHDIVVNPLYPKHILKERWIEVLQGDNGWFSVNSSKAIIITTCGILWDKKISKLYNQDMQELKSIVEEFDTHDREQENISESWNDFERECLSKKQEYKKRMKCEEVGEALGNKAINFLDEKLSALDNEHDASIESIRNHQVELVNFFKQIEEDVNSERVKIIEEEKMINGNHKTYETLAVDAKDNSKDNKRAKTAYIKFKYVATEKNKAFVNDIEKSIIEEIKRTLGNALLSEPEIFET